MLNLNEIKNIYFGEYDNEWFIVSDINENYYTFKHDSEPHFNNKIKKPENLNRIIGVEKIKGTPLYNYIKKRVELNNLKSENERKKMIEQMNNNGCFEVRQAHINSHLTGPKILKTFNNEYDAHEFLQKVLDSGAVFHTTIVKI